MSCQNEEKKILLCAPPSLGVEGGGGVMFPCPERETCLVSGDTSSFENGACRTATTSICMFGQLAIKTKIKIHMGSTKQPPWLQVEA